jgi:hypothetical protein
MFYNNRNKKNLGLPWKCQNKSRRLLSSLKTWHMQKAKKKQDKLFFITFFLAIHSFDELKQLPDEAVSHKKRSEDTSKQEGVASCPG